MNHLAKPWVKSNTNLWLGAVHAGINKHMDIPDINGAQIGEVINPWVSCQRHATIPNGEP